MRKTFLSSLLPAAAWDSRMSSWDLDFGVSAQTTLQCWMIRVTHPNCLNILSNCLTVLRCQIDQYRGRLLCQDVFTRILSVNRATSFNSIQHLHSAVFCCCDARSFGMFIFVIVRVFNWNWNYHSIFSMNWINRIQLKQSIDSEFGASSCDTEIRVEERWRERE